MEENYGDWVIDKKKFPNGLKPVFDYIKSLGMKPGLWISVGSASADSKFLKIIRNGLCSTKISIPRICTWTILLCGQPVLEPGWYDYIKGVLMKLALEYGLEYMKLDFTIVTSPYRFDKRISGCYALNHAGHRDHNESLYSNYMSAWKLFDELHNAKPNLFIDCTFETMGALQMIDYSMLKHAEGNWLSNFQGPPDEDVDLRVRNMAWWRSPAIPSTALVIGNPQMQDPGWKHILNPLPDHFRLCWATPENYQMLI